jgi:hypothetical protein
MTLTLRHWIFGNTVWNKPSPLGWVLIFGLTRVVEFHFDAWWTKAGAWGLGAFVALVVLPKAVHELRLLTTDEVPNWEHQMWTRAVVVLGRERLERFGRLLVICVLLIAAQVVLYGLNINWTAVLRDVGLQVAMVLLYWSSWE